MVRPTPLGAYSGWEGTYPPYNSYGKVPNQYGPYAYCSMDKAEDAQVQKRRLQRELVQERGI